MRDWHWIKEAWITAGWWYALRFTVAVLLRREVDYDVSYDEEIEVVAYSGDEAMDHYEYGRYYAWEYAVLLTRCRFYIGYDQSI